ASAVFIEPLADTRAQCAECRAQRGAVAAAVARVLACARAAAAAGRRPRFNTGLRAAPQAGGGRVTAAGAAGPEPAGPGPGTGQPGAGARVSTEISARRVRAAPHAGARLRAELRGA